MYITKDIYFIVCHWTNVVKCVFHNVKIEQLFSCKLKTSVKTQLIRLGAKQGIWVLIVFCLDSYDQTPGSINTFFILKF